MNTSPADLTNITHSHFIIFIKTQLEHMENGDVCSKQCYKKLVGIGNDLIQNFEEQDITAEIVPILSNAQLIQLGLTTIATTGSSFRLPK